MRSENINSGTTTSENISTEILCYTSCLPEGSTKQISFMELLLNENWANGQFICSEEVYFHVGDRNQQITAKQNYEFLLRASLQYPIKAIGAPAAPLSPFQSFSWNSYLTDCYIAGKYQKELVAAGYFHPVIKSLLETALQFPEPENAVSFLEKMLSYSSEFYDIDDDTQPILLLKSSEACYNVMNLFIDELAKALRLCRQRIEVFDVTKDSLSLERLTQRRFKAIVGIQTNLIHSFTGKKYLILLDHPINMYGHFTCSSKDCCLLTHDRNYLSFARRYFRDFKGYFYFPPAGTLPDDVSHTVPASAIPKQYGIIFMGTYHDYRHALAAIYSYPRFYRLFASRFLLSMRRNPAFPAEKAFAEVLDDVCLTLNDNEFLNMFASMKPVTDCITAYFREKVIRTLLNAGIKIHVYGDSWEAAPFCSHKYLVHHPALPMDESLQAIQKSKISLNIMSWHKDGLTERILNPMLCQTVVLSDKSTRLEEEFVDGEDIVLFDLSKIECLPELVRRLLSDENYLGHLARNGYRKAMEKHRWCHRAQKLLDFMSTYRNNPARDDPT